MSPSILLLSPPLPRAHCRIPLDLFLSSNCTPGGWCYVSTTTQRYTCRPWPTNSKSYVHVQPFISLLSKEEETYQSQQCTVTAASDSLLIASSAQVSPVRVDPGQWKRKYGYEWGTASDYLRRTTVVKILQGTLLSEGCLIQVDAGIVFTVTAMNPAGSDYLITEATEVSLDLTSNRKPSRLISLQTDANLIPPMTTRDTSETSIPGLEKAYQTLLEVVSYPLLYPDWFRKLGVECPKGVLLHGPPGVGKTLLVSTIARICGAKLMTINGPEVYGPYVGQSEEMLRGKFHEAVAMAQDGNKPCILFIDELDALTPNRTDSKIHEARVVAQLLTLMDGMHSRGRLVVIGATNRPNAIDPALRRPGRFDREVSIDPPSESARCRILESQTCAMPLSADVDIATLATMTNGYVGADLASLCREAAIGAVLKWGKNGQSAEDCESPVVTMVDFKIAMTNIRPSKQRSANTSVVVEKGSYKWEDVGGLEDVKRKLRQAVEWPVLYKDTFKRLGLRPPRGVLLYGPPGCSKTTLVKIIAATSGASFFSINGAALYSPFVGDSEKQIRSTFACARSSAPAVIFFDEIEAIVGKREMEGGGGNGGTGGDSVQERVLSMLLNEMDGVEAVESVLVIGATNRPDMLDAALMRPGRFDRLIFVPPPDFEARLSILEIHMNKTPADDDVDLVAVAKLTDMYTGADLQNVCREAAMIALRSTRDSAFVNMSHFLQALHAVRPSLTRETLMEYRSLNGKFER